jgi:hypothetical protein
MSDTKLIHQGKVRFELQIVEHKEEGRGDADVYLRDDVSIYRLVLTREEAKHFTKSFLQAIIKWDNKPIKGSELCELLGMTRWEFIDAYE